MNNNDLAFTPALELAQLIRLREVSPLELVEVYLERIERLNPQLGSYFTVTADLAIADAKNKTELLTTTSELPPFFGVPISIKDLSAVAGVTCTYGNPALLNNIANHDDGVVTRIKQAGFIILGKTATSELGSYPYSEPAGFPPARNPWNLEYTPGGSSGGAASSVAAGLSAIAQGSDGGGSVRGPAACCGVVGIKPARGRVSKAPVGDRLGGIAVDGPLARTVADAAAMLDVISGYVTGDPYWLPNPQPSFLSATQVKLDSLKIAFSTSILPFGEADANCKQGVLKTVGLLAQFGHQVEEKYPDFSSLIEPFIVVWQAGIAAAGIPSPALQPLNQWLLAKNGSVAEYLQALSQMQIVSRQIIAFFDTVDVLVLPVYLHSPIRVGGWADLSANGNNGELVNGVRESSANGGSLVFDGSDDYVDIGSLGSQFTNFTVEIWFKSDSVTNYRNPIDCNWLIENGSYSNLGPRLEQNSAGNLNWVVGSGSDVYSFVTLVPSGLSSIPYHHAVITKTSSTNFNGYYNGNYTSSLSFSGWAGSMLNVNIGRGFSLSGERWFIGKIPSVKIYNRALSAAEISQNYNALKSRYI